MKKIILVISVVLLSFGAAMADMMVNPASLPANITQFLNTNFKGANIVMAEQDYDSYEIKMSSGAEIEFYTNGDWKEIKTYQNFPVNVLPAPVAQAVKQAQPQAFIIKAEKTWNGFEIKTSNNMEIFITPNGQIMGQKFDD